MFPLKQTAVRLKTLSTDAEHSCTTSFFTVLAILEDCLGFFFTISAFHPPSECVYTIDQRGYQSNTYTPRGRAGVLHMRILAYMSTFEWHILQFSFIVISLLEL